MCRNLFYYCKPSSSWYKILIIVCMCFCSLGDISKRAAAALTDKEILVKIYEATGGKHWNNSNGWLKLDNYCNWYGVSCVYEEESGDKINDDNPRFDDDNTTQIGANDDDAGEQTYTGNSTDSTADDDNPTDEENTPTSTTGTVAGIKLDGNNLIGTMPEELFQLPSLTTVDVKNNQKLTVPLQSIKNAALLEQLFLSNTNTTDLQGLEHASNLTRLHLTNNNITGTIPSSIFHLTNLEQLFLAFNRLTGTIPADGLYNLTKLTDLYLYNNFLNGTIPEDIGAKNTKLRYLTLGGNMITGTLPSSLNKLKNLRSISIRNLRDDMDLGGVGLSGPLLDFHKSKVLVEIHLNHNNLTGTIPATLLEKTKTDGRWVSINLTSNALSGSIPGNLTRFTNLSIDLTDNNFRPEDLPKEFCQMSDWMLGLVGKYGCDAILCPISTSSPLGRHTKEYKCANCSLPGSYNDWDDDQPLDDDSPSQENETFVPPPQSPFLGRLECNRTDAIDQGIAEVASNTSMERDILTELYHKTNGIGWSNKDGWLDKNRGICSWYGVQCRIIDGSRAGDAGVEAILLQDNRLNGEIPWSVYNLPLLAELNVERNNIFVTFNNIQSAAGTLQSMFLGQTKIDDLAKLTKAENLTKLSLSRIGLTGSFPEELFSLQNLKEILLENNNITGSLPSKISNWKYLERIDVTKNKLSGSLPSFKNLKKLRILDLSGNEWSGTLPTRLNKLPNLEVLSLYGTFSKSKLTGSILDFASNTKLVELYLQDQNFFGSIPTSFLSNNANKDRMVEVNLARNQLTGTLPKELGERFDRLTIELAGNKISHIPTSLCTKDSWMEGEVKFSGCDAIACPPGKFATPFGRATRFLGNCQNCTLLESSPYYGSVECPNATNVTNATNGTSSGSLSEKDILVKFFHSTNGTTWRNKKNWLDDSMPICTWTGVNCNEGRVQALRLEFNELVGQVPPEIYDLPFLEDLGLSRNKDLTVSFKGIRKAKNLTKIYMAETKIILDGIGKAPSLQILSIPNCGLAGDFYDEILEITTLNQLDLSYNMFNGTLPTGISKLSNLMSLLLNNNEFTGSIPASLGQLSNLTELDLSVNGFEGSLPEELNSLTNIEVLAIKNQNNAQGFPSLTGKLLDFQNSSRITEIYLQDNALEGTIPSTFLMSSVGRNETIYVGLSRNQLTGIVPEELSDIGHLLIALDDNNITGIHSSLCKTETLMQGNVGKFGCDAILCKAGSYQTFSGRQTTDGLPCKSCPFSGGAPYMGSTSCVNAADKIARDILTTLYTATKGTNWYLKDNWTKPDIPVCQWYGVGCSTDGSTVSSLKLGANNLLGTIPPDLFDLPGLKELWLFSNPINFNFTGIERANNLTTLLLDGTGLVSLDGLGKGTSLVHLDLSFNQINGTFPYDEIYTLVNLKTLSLAYNNLMGGLVSYAFDKLVDLQKIRLDSNFFIGDLPDFADFGKLDSLDLANNGFSSPIPEYFLKGIKDKSKPIIVNLAANNLTGTISSDVFGEFENLTLYIRGNKIEEIDISLCQKKNWNGGDVGLYQCGGLACPPHTYNDIGRQNSDSNNCQACDAAVFYGSDFCSSESRNPNSITTSGGMPMFREIPSLMIAVFLAVLGTAFCI